MSPREEYISKLNQYDVFICNAPYQFSLGNIIRAIYLGKKVYLRGENYTYFKKREYKVFNVDDIKSMTWKDFTKPLSIEEKIINQSLLRREYNVDETVKKWDTFIKSVS